jgi:hypothetical protein
MILGGGQCQKCKCIPCDPCEQECTNPHTGDAYEVVYTLYSLGVEIGNTTDGYLTASGSRDEDDPYDGMDGSSPWYQQVEGGFSFGPSVTRNPCTVRVSFWRSTRTLGPTVFPPPAATLTVSKVTVSCTAGRIRFGENVISEGESQDFDVTFPLVAGTGDQSADDPRSAEGTFEVSPLCREASFSITARIEWTTSNRLHTLYGLVRECYEIGTPCAEFCDGDPAPDEIYLTISNLEVTAFDEYDSVTYSPEQLDSTKEYLNSTFVLPRTENFCGSFAGAFSAPPTSANLESCDSLSGGTALSIEVSQAFKQIYIRIAVGRGNLCAWAIVMKASMLDGMFPICGTAYIESGQGTDIAFIGPSPATYVGSFDWEITT